MGPALPVTSTRLCRKRFISWQDTFYDERCNTYTVDFLIIVYVLQVWSWPVQSWSHRSHGSCTEKIGSGKESNAYGGAYGDCIAVFSATIPYVYNIASPHF